MRKKLIDIVMILIPLIEHQDRMIKEIDLLLEKELILEFELRKLEERYKN